MNPLFRMLRATYHLVPSRVRTIPVFQRWSQALGRRFGGHDGVYTDYYYRNIVDPGAQFIAGPFADLLEELGPHGRIIDVGCGTGAVLGELVRRGWQGFGLEYSEAGLAICRERGLNVRKFDLTKAVDTSSEERYNVAISMEVAEHLPAIHADRYVALLTSLADFIVFTAAPPGQGGTDHLNEQPPEYWFDKFAAHGFTFLEPRTEAWKSRLSERGLHLHYQKNLMLFAKT